MASAEDTKQIVAAIHEAMEDNPKCPYRGDKGSERDAPNPHVSVPYAPEAPILDSVLGHIGNTPMVRVERLMRAEGVECEVLAKCEFFNAGGSVKDRIGLRMVLDAEKRGLIKPGDTLIEPTSGNTGIGEALVAAIKGYKMVITMPEKMSHEKSDVLKALGAEIVRTPTSAAWDSPESHVAVAMRLQKELPNAHILNQYSNPSNPMAHYEGTAEEILRQCDNRIDAIVMTAGTGGTITGVARKLKERLPNIKIIGVDPIGSILAEPKELNTGLGTSYQVEGTGYDFIPKVLDRTIVDEWLKSDDQASFTMARRMIREEGLLCGGSSGAAMSAALDVAKRYKKGQRVVVLLADSVRNYMSKHLNDGWMVDNGFMQEESKQSGSRGQWLSERTVKDLGLPKPVSASEDTTCAECVKILTDGGFDQLPVVDGSGAVVGMVTLGNLTSRIVSGRVEPSAKINDDVIYRHVKTVQSDTTLDLLSSVFERHYYAVVVEGGKLAGVATQIDLLNYVVKERK